MKYKVLPGCALYDQLQELHTKIRYCRKQAIDLIKELGFKNGFKKGFVLAGGFYGLEPIDGKKPEGYSWAWPDKSAVMPSAKSKTGKAILARIEALPVVEYDELNNLVNYDEDLSARPASKGTGTVINFCPGYRLTEDYVVIEIPVYQGRKYTPAEGMIEILESEYNTLMALS